MKSYFGHLLGASGVVELIATLRALEEGRVPANLNLDNPDPRCDVRLVGGEPMEIAGAIAMKNSFGFGGANAVLVVRTLE
jgi:3-oxoacyl-[acyl-carrier-protein] synthase II